MADKAAKLNFKVGDFVRARRMSAKSVELEGEIVKIHKGADDCVDIELENGSVETVHAPDCEAVKAPKKAKEEAES